MIFEYYISGDGTMAQYTLCVPFDYFTSIFKSPNNFQKKVINSVYLFNKYNYKYPHLTFMTNKQFNVISKLIKLKDKENGNSKTA